MTLDVSDISFVLSGGASNSNPLLSLGGDPSVTTVTTGLFNNIDEDQTDSGYIDYRCIYIANDSNVDDLYEVKAYIDETVTGGVDIELGFAFRDDVQQVSISDGTSVVSGSFTLKYEDENFDVDYDADVATWASNFQTAIRAITNLEDVTVSGGTNGSIVIFTVEFIGVAGDRYHPALEVVDDSGLSIGAGNVSVLKVFDGSPINSIATETDAVTTPPNGVEFATYTVAEKAAIGDLRATDIVPVWFRRTCPEGQAPLADDGFALKISGNPFPPE